MLPRYYISVLILLKQHNPVFCLANEFSVKKVEPSDSDNTSGDKNMFPKYNVIVMEQFN